MLSGLWLLEHVFGQCFVGQFMFFRETDSPHSSDQEPKRIPSWCQDLLFQMDEVDGIKAEPSTVCISRSLYD